MKKEVKRQEENVLNVIAKDVGKTGYGRLILVLLNVSSVVIAVTGSAKNLI